MAKVEVTRAELVWPRKQNGDGLTRQAVWRGGVAVSPGPPAPTWAAMSRRVFRRHGRRRIRRLPPTTGLHDVTIAPHVGAGHTGITVPLRPAAVAPAYLARQPANHRARSRSCARP